MKRDDIYLVCWDPTIGREIQKTRPCVIVSPDELNQHLSTVIVVPLTSGRRFPFRPTTKFQGKDGVAAVDQLRTVDKQRLVKRLGKLSDQEARDLSGTLQEMFARLGTR